MSDPGFEYDLPGGELEVVQATRHSSVREILKREMDRVPSFVAPLIKELLQWVNTDALANEDQEAAIVARLRGLNYGQEITSLAVLLNTLRG